MLSSEEKLQRFSESVYKDAQNQCNALIEEAKKKAGAETDIFETECLEAAYKTIKELQTKRCRKQKSSQKAPSF